MAENFLSRFYWMLKVREIWSVDCQGNHSNSCHQMSNFKVITISAGAPPQTPLGELTVLPRPPSWI